MSNDASDSNDPEALKRQIAELQAQLAQAEAAKPSAAPSADTPRTDTGGGANIGHGVRIGNGHFIGRDYIQHLTQIVQSGEDAEAAKNTIALYLRNLSTQLTGLRLGEIDGSMDHSRRQALQLGDVYVPLHTTLQIDERQTLPEWLARKDSPSRAKPEDGRATRPVSALEALTNHHCLTLLGKPGSGKSSFGARVLLALAEAWRGKTSELQHLGDSWTHGTLFPIRVVLRKFADQLPAGDATGRASDVWDYIGRELHACGVGLKPDDHCFVQRLVHSHGALMVFDGIDECGSPERRLRVMQSVSEFMRTHQARSRFVLTARPYAWPDGPEPEKGVYALADFDDEQITQFVETWYQTLAKRGWRPLSEAQPKARELLAVRQRNDLQPLMRNPLLLTLVALLHNNNSKVPDDRADLYEKSVELLLERWNQSSGADKALRDELLMPQLKLSDVRVKLQKLAFDIHQQGAGRKGALDIGEGRVLAALRPLLNNDHNKAALVSDYIERRAGLLLGQGERDGERQFVFPHRTFQEYLAACHLAGHPQFERECLPLARGNPSHWEVVLPLAARVAGPARGANAADHLIGGVAVEDFLKQGKRPSPSEWTVAALAGMQLHEIGTDVLNDGGPGKATLDRVRGWLVAALPVHPDDGGLPAPQRAQIGDLLAALGDPRFDPERWYLPADEMLGFARIDADPGFMIGTRKSDRKRIAAAIGHDVGEDEINDQCTPSPEFHIARYPVTVAQFRAYLHDAKADPGNPDALRDPDNRPVRWIGWAEAVAYADWLDGTLRNAPALDSHPLARLVREQGWQIALPSELEWEKAARGGLIGQAFAWDDDADPERANYHDTGIADSSASGCFPANGYGLHDMLGNLFEWTRSAYQPYPPATRHDTPPTTNDPCVVRGGSWDFLRIYARCASRGRLLPGSRNYDLGFRVVLRSAPVRSLGAANPLDSGYLRL